MSNQALTVNSFLIENNFSGMKSHLKMGFWFKMRRARGSPALRDLPRIYSSNVSRNRRCQRSQCP